MIKKILLLLLIPAGAAFSQQKDHVAESVRVFNDIRSREFAKVTALFDSSVSARIDTTRLRQVWDNLLKLAGPFVKVIDTTSDHQQYFDVVIQHCQFEKRKIDFKVVFGVNEKIKGISFLPGEPAVQYKLPPYFIKDSINEKTLIMQNGPYRLPGILTTPARPGKFPAIILIHGSGPNDKDETVGPTKIFKDLSIGLSRKGFAVYRYDKRSRVFAGRMSKDKNVTVEDETIEDAVAAINLVKKDSLVDSTAIFVVGHSMGGMLLPRIAKKAGALKGLIFLAANGRHLEDLLLEQTTYVLSFDTSGQDKTQILDSIKREAAKIKSLRPLDPDSSFIFHIPRAYWLDLNNYDPIASASQLKIPMLFLQGGRDYQVTEKDFNMWKDGLKNSTAKFKLYPDLNHFFIAGKGKSTPAEYTKAANVDESVIKDIAAWATGLK
jgi:dienelactone hydrolase